MAQIQYLKPDNKYVNVLLHTFVWCPVEPITPVFWQIKGWVVEGVHLLFWSKLFGIFFFSLSILSWKLGWRPFKTPISRWHLFVIFLNWFFVYLKLTSRNAHLLLFLFWSCLLLWFIEYLVKITRTFWWIFCPQSLNIIHLNERITNR